MKGEVAVRSQLLSAMAEQQNLMDALTAVSLNIMYLVACYILPTMCIHCICVCTLLHVCVCVLHVYTYCVH